MIMDKATPSIGDKIHADIIRELALSWLRVLQIRSNLLKSCEQPAMCVVGTYGAHGPKNTAITRMLVGCRPETDATPVG